MNSIRLFAFALVGLAALPAAAQNNVRLSFGGLNAAGFFCVDAQNLSTFASPGSINRTQPPGVSPVGDVVVPRVDLAPIGQPGDRQRGLIAPSAPGAQNAFIFVQQDTRVSNEILTNDRTVCSQTIPPILLPPTGGGGGDVVIVPLPATVDGLQRNVARFAADGVLTGGYQISDQIAFGFARGPGVAAEGRVEGHGWNAWVSPRFVGTRNASAGTSVAGDLFEIIGGIDYRIAENLILGLALGGSRQDSDGKAYGLSLTRDGWFLGPYIGWRIRPTTILDVWTGYARADQDLSVPGERGAYATDSWFLSANLTEIIATDLVELRPRLTFLATQDNAGAFTSSAGTRYLSDAWGQSAVAASLGASRPFALNADTVLRPFIRIGVAYALDMALTEAARVNGSVKDLPRWSGQVRAGATLQVGTGIEIGLQAGYLSAFVDGVDAWEGRALLSILF